MNNATAGPSRPRPRPPTHPKHPFVSAQNRAEGYDGIFRVVIITTGSVASVKIPLIAGELSKDPRIQIQIVATPSSTHFYSQSEINTAVRKSWSLAEDGDSIMDMDDSAENSVGGGVVGEEKKETEIGVKVWRDVDEWSDWKKVGDPILHIELRRWADLILVAPCSADFLAKIAAGFSDNLALSLLRATPPTTPTILCPAMNTQMYLHPYTAKHLRAVQEDLGYMVLGPQMGGKLACGDDGPGKMTAYPEIVDTIQNFASAFHSRHISHGDEADRPIQTINPPTRALTSVMDSIKAQDLDRTDSGGGGSSGFFGAVAHQQVGTMTPGEGASGQGIKALGAMEAEKVEVGERKGDAWVLHSSDGGGDGGLWAKKFWIGS